MDQKLKLGTEGYSPRLLQKAVRQAGKAASFKEASEDLLELAEVSISATHLQRLSGRVGKEWAQARDGDVALFREDKLKAEYAQSAQVAAVMIDGGRVQTRGEDQAPGVRDRKWRETKVACCLSLSSKEQPSDPKPQPPEKFLDRSRVAQLVAEIKSRSRPAQGRTPAEPATKNNKQGQRGKRPKNKRQSRTEGPKKLVRTVVATMAQSETFGWQMAAEVQRRGLDRARRKACVCDGQKYNWTLFEMHLLPWGFVAVLDFVHLLSYLYEAAATWSRACKKGELAAWKQYEKWLHWAWSGKAKTLLKDLRAAWAQVSKPSVGAGEDDPRRVMAEVMAEVLGYVENNRTRMNYPEYRRLGLPISSAPVESTIKQINRRVKGTEKFWIEGGVEAILQIRAAYLSEDGRATRYWSRPRPYARAVGSGRLPRAAAA